MVSVSLKLEATKLLLNLENIGNYQNMLKKELKHEYHHHH